MKRLLFIVSEDWYFVSHRLHLAETAIKEGYEVGLLCKVESQRDLIESAGVELINWRINRGSLNPLIEIKALWDLHKSMRTFKPDLIHAVALKPVFYTALISRLNDIDARIFALGGLGFVFSSRKLLALILRPLLKKTLRWAFLGRNTRLILQNPDDQDLLIKMNTIEEERIRIIRGAGVNTRAFISKTLPQSDTPLVILPARLIWNKGAGDFVAAARRIKSKGLEARFALVGGSDEHNPDCIPMSQIDDWVAEGVIEIWGMRNDMSEVMKEAAIVCLPSSYGEGLPKALLEAASSSRPMVAYDVPGCREIIIDGENGYLVPLSDINGFTAALEHLLIDTNLRKRMGVAGREMVLRGFSQEQVAAETLAVWNDVLS